VLSPSRSQHKSLMLTCLLKPAIPLATACNRAANNKTNAEGLELALSLLEASRSFALTIPLPTIQHNGCSGASASIDSRMDIQSLRLANRLHHSQGMSGMAFPLSHDFRGVTDRDPSRSLSFGSQTCQSQYGIWCNERFVRARHSNPLEAR